MRFNKRIYLSHSIKNKHKIIWKLKHGMGMSDIYVISLSTGRDQLDCTHCCFLKQRILRKNLGQVVGLAKGREEMEALLLQMFEDCVKATGTANIKEYLSGRVA